VDRIERDGNVVKVEPTNILIDKLCSDRTLDILYSCLEAAADPKRTKNCFAHLPFNIGCKTGTSEIQGAFHSDATKDKRIFNRGVKVEDGYNLGSIVCIMPLEKPKYTIMVAVLRQKGPWREKIESHNANSDSKLKYTRPSDNPRFGIDVAGPAASQIMTYLYNNDIELHPKVETAVSPLPPTNIKGGRSSMVQRVSSELSPFVGNATNGTPWCTTTCDEGGNVTISSIEPQANVVPDVRNMGLSDAIYILEGLGMVVTHEGAGGVIEQSLEPGSLISDMGGSIHLTLGIKKRDSKK
jgi:hypothetical protein